MVNLKNVVSISLPTKKQTIRGVEVVIVAFASGFLYAWVHSANPFSKDAVVAAWVGGVATVYSLAKIFLTNL